MIDEVDENMRVLIRFEDGSGSVLSVTSENSEEVGFVDFGASVVNLALIVDVDSWGKSIGRLVEELTWVRVVVVVSDIVISQMNDLITRDAILKHKLDSVMGISLMTIVAIGVGASHNDSPVVGGISGSAG